MKYFSINELTRSATAARKGIDNTPTAEVSYSLQLLVHYILDPLRKAWGAPIIVTSGYRCPKLNKVVGGAKTSQHVLGQAADIRTVSDNPKENRRLLDLIVKLGLPYDQLINEYPDSNGNPDWIHVSYGPRQRRQKLTCKGGKYYAGL